MKPEKKQNLIDQKSRLLAPGPVPVLPEVLAKLSEPVVHHRVPEFEALLARSLKNLKEVFKTQQNCMIHSSTGTGAMESAIVNTLSPGDEIIGVCFGRFGERWAEIAESYGIKVHRLSGEWGTVLKAQDLFEFLEDLQSKGTKIKAVMIQACETSTGTLHPIKELGEYFKDKESLLLVDAITSLGAAELPMDDWHLDVVIGGSQKAFALPTGLSFISLSQKAWKAYESSKCPKFYFDLKPELKANQKNQTRFSSSVSLIKALDKSLQNTVKLGLDDQLQSIAKSAEGFRKSTDVFGLKNFSESPSPSLTVLKIPKGVDGVALRDHCEKKFGVTFIGGQEHLKGQIIRIGHMGAITLDDYQVALEALGKSLNDCGYSVDDEQIKLAIEIFTHNYKA